MAREGDKHGDLRRETVKLLENLGPTVDAVAATLQAEGIRGVRRDESGCVVARYINAVMGADPRIRKVAVKARSVLLVRRAWWMSVVCVPVPSAVTGFIVEFDRGGFPALVTDSAGDQSQSYAPPDTKNIGMTAYSTTASRMLTPWG
ncbi:MAG TPA: hypothetical protein VNU19_22030 [Candidatus Acidoferrum sp.]|jgi:hypothetical protein|nr:hypothetical protein [Candidatus Acidoferrum sp.]